MLLNLIHISILILDPHKIIIQKTLTKINNRIGVKLNEYDTRYRDKLGHLCLN